MALPVLGERRNEIKGERDRERERERERDELGGRKGTVGASLELTRENGKAEKDKEEDRGREERRKRERERGQLGNKERLDESMAKTKLNLALSTNEKNMWEIENESNL